MPLLLLAFAAGVLTVLAPCILPVLPVILGGSLAATKNHRPHISRAIIIIASLAFSIIIFSLLLKATTALLGVPQVVWQVISGGIITLFGLAMLFPNLWVRVIAKTGLYESSNKLLGSGFQQEGNKGAVLMGLALGPVFNSCSPTYALIVASILPASFIEGLTYLLAYTLGLCLILLLIVILGQKIVGKLGWLSDPGRLFHKAIGGLFILVGIGVLFGLDKSLQAYILEKGWYDPISNLEESIRR